MNKKGIIVTCVAAFAAVIVAAWGGYVFCTQVHIEDAKPPVLVPFYIVLVLLAAFVDELIHEGGHLLMGACCSMGMKVPKIRVFRSSSIDVYPTGAKRMRLRMILTAGAGLFFDLIIIAFGVIALLAPSVPAPFAVLMPYALYSFIINVVPMECAGGKNDGLVIWELITNQPTAQVLLAILRVQGLTHAGMPLKEVDESLLLDVPQVQEDDINFIILTQLRYEYYLAKDDDSEAYKYFARYKELIDYLPSEYKEKHS